MDPWQQTVETRLGQLHADLRGIGADLGKVTTDVATLTERVAGLPTKGFIVGTVLTTLAVIAALMALQTVVQNFVIAPKAPVAAAASK